MRHAVCQRERFRQVGLRPRQRRATASRRTGKRRTGERRTGERRSRHAPRAMHNAACQRKPTGQVGLRSRIAASARRRPRIAHRGDRRRSNGPPASIPMRVGSRPAGDRSTAKWRSARRWPCGLRVAATGGARSGLDPVGGRATDLRRSARRRTSERRARHAARSDRFRHDGLGLSLHPRHAQRGCTIGHVLWPHEFRLTPYLCPPPLSG